MFWHTFFQTALIQRPIEIYPWNQLQMATNTLNFQWKKAEPMYLNPLQRYSNLKSGLTLSGNFDSFKEILVQVNKAVLGFNTSIHNTFSPVLPWYSSVYFPSRWIQCLSCFLYYIWFLFWSLHFVTLISLAPDLVNHTYFNEKMLWIL